MNGNSREQGRYFFLTSWPKGRYFFFWKENKGHLSNRQIRIRFLRLDFFLEGGASLHYIGFAVLQWSQNLFLEGDLPKNCNSSQLNY